MLLSSHRLGLGATPFAVASQVYGPAASGPGLPRVGGLYGGYGAWIPPNQDDDRIDRFNNPNPGSFPGASSDVPRALRNWVGPLTYCQFLMDHGRDLKPDDAQLCELSLDSGVCRMRTESVAGRSFRFPPREQPMHAARRAIIRSLDIVSDRSSLTPSTAFRDRVALVTFDRVEASRVRRSFSTRYVDVMNDVAPLQSVGDKSMTTATESGLLLAQQMLRPVSRGGQAREGSTKVVVLLTDGMPNAYGASDREIDGFLSATPGGDFYGGGHYWLDAALMRIFQMEADRIDVYPVGVGLGTDYNFMDRMARTGGTGGSSGQSPRGSGNPAEYEQRMVDIFEKIIKKPTAKLVQ